jgi:hypothetical protein
MRNKERIKNINIKINSCREVTMERLKGWKKCEISYDNGKKYINSYIFQFYYK